LYFLIQEKSKSKQIYGRFSLSVLSEKCCSAQRQQTAKIVYIPHFLQDANEHVIEEELLLYTVSIKKRIPCIAMVGEMNGMRIEFHKITNQISFLFIIIKKQFFKFQPAVRRRKRRSHTLDSFFRERGPQFYLQATYLKY